MNCMCSSTCLLPVLVEEEESVQDSTAEVPTVAASMEGGKKNVQICVQEGEKERAWYFETVYLRLLLSACNFAHPHTNSSLTGTEQLTSSGATTFSDGSSPQSRSSFIHGSQSGSGMGSITSDPSHSQASTAKKDALLLCGKNKRELVRPALLPLDCRISICTY